MERPRGERLKAETERGQVRNPEGSSRKRRGSERESHEWLLLLLYHGNAAAAEPWSLVIQSNQL